MLVKIATPCLNPSPSSLRSKSVAIYGYGTMAKSYPAKTGVQQSNKISKVLSSSYFSSASIFLILNTFRLLNCIKLLNATLLDFRLCFQLLYGHASGKTISRLDVFKPYPKVRSLFIHGTGMMLTKLG